MISQRDRWLQLLGITQWSLRHPTVLQGEVTIVLPTHIRLVMVADKVLTLNESLISDVLRALKISTDLVLLITPGRAATLSTKSRCNSWQLGCYGGILELKGVLLISPSLEELRTNPNARIALWKQICKYDHDFFPKNT